MWFQDFVTVFNQSYNCQTSHYLDRNRPPNARLSILLFDPCLNTTKFSFLTFFSGGEGTQEGEGHGNKVRPTKSSKSSNFQINLYDTKRIDEKHQERIHYMHNQANAKFITSSNVVVISFLIVILNLVVRFWNFNSRAWRNNYCLKRLLAAVPAA